MTFGTTPSGERVERHVLSNGPMRAAILSYGAILQSLEVSGVDVVLGYDNLGDYLTRSRYFGAVVGRYGNRIAGGRFTLDGRDHELPVNNGPNSLHGGTHGFDTRVWRITAASDTAVTLEHVSPDGEQGYPGTLTVSVTYTLTGDAIRIDYHAVTDAPTVLNLTNHSYFNLAGGGDVLKHVVRIDADHYLPVDATQIPTGELAPVAGTPFDFTSPYEIGERIADPLLGGGYDHCYVLRGGMEVREPAGGSPWRSPPPSRACSSTRATSWTASPPRTESTRACAWRPSTSPTRPTGPTSPRWSCAPASGSTPPPPTASPDGHRV